MPHILIVSVAFFGGGPTGVRLALLLQLYNFSYFNFK